MQSLNLDLFGVYVAPLAILMIACAAVWTLLRRVADMAGLVSRVWHPALFFGAVYVILFGVAVLWLTGQHDLMPRWR